MKAVRRWNVVAAALLALGLTVGPAQAQLARTFVSSLGSDGNTCGRLDPCRTFQAAHDKTLASGEITVLDAGGYGAVTITKAISIINDGVGEAGVLVSGGLNGITVAAAATDAISLRGLTVKGITFGGGNGIVFNSGATLTVENCAVRTLNGTGAGIGIRFQPNGSSHLFVLNTIVADNADLGMRIEPTGGGSVRATLGRVQLTNNFDGLAVTSGTGGSTATIDAMVENSIVTRSSSNGIRIAAGAPRASLMVIRSVVAHNGSGIVAAGGNATLRIGQSTLTGNATTWSVSGGGILQSYGDNNINGNGDGDPAIPTVIAKK